MQDKIIQRIIDAYSGDIEEVLEWCNLTHEDVIRLLLEKGLIDEETTPWAFEPDSEEYESDESSEEDPF